MGIAGVAKVTAICIATAGGAAACIAGGVVPSLPADQQPRPRVERPARTEPVAQAAAERLAAVAKVDYEPAAPDPQPKPGPQPQPSPGQQSAESEPSPEPVPITVNETVESEPAPEPEPVPVTSAGGGSPAGEFGP
jgi:outer membrane biosynthesis protein TonB